MRFFCLWLMMIKCFVALLRRNCFQVRGRERETEREVDMKLINHICC